MTSSIRPLAECLEVRGRFKRSVLLEKDYDASSQDGEYIVTPTAREALRRLSEGMVIGSPCRAWTLTGPYGVGKSAFAVFVSRLCCTAGKQTHQARLQLKEADPKLFVQLSRRGLFDSKSKGFLPILATARRMSASRCLAEGMVAAALSARNRKIKASVRNITNLLSNRQNGQAWDTREIVGALISLSEAAKAAEYEGLIFIVDELGKLFEYSARYPQKGDVFVLQEIAEQAARSGSAPIIFIGLLHQSFEEYGLHLDLATRREWAKIQGRFEDIAFLEPADQIIRMIAKAIRRTPGSHNCASARFLGTLAAEASKAQVAPPGIQKEDFEMIVRGAYPLHPVTLVALPYVFRRFAQNERSLFSYLSSMEPYGFQEFIKSHALDPDSPPVIRLGDLFDYFTRNFGSGLYRHPHSLRWLEAADVLERKDSLSPLHREVVKTIGVLNALGEFCHLNATEEVISLAISDLACPSTELKEALRFLKEESIATYRKFNRAYCIWEGSDVDIEERVALGERKVRDGLNLADSVKKYLPVRPMVARRHSFETGALRYFAVEYVDDIESIGAHMNPCEADGKVLVCLAESPIIAQRFWDLAMKSAEKIDLIFAIPQLIGELRAVVTELGALRWAWENTPELRDDRVARREMSLRIAGAEQLLQRYVDGLLDPRDEPVGSGCLWIYRGRLVPVHSPVEVSQLLSDVCDKIYVNAPRVRNELIARRSLSSAAAAARRNLIERMLSHHTEEALGIVGYPPERSIYESVLRATGLHRQNKDGVWGFHAPKRTSSTRMLASWDFLCEAVFNRGPEPIPLDRLFSELVAPPYGVLPGLHPVLLCAFIRAYSDETTLYREGTFLPEPGIADFEVLMRRADLFAVAGSRMSGGRALVVQRMAKGLKVKAATVPVVRALFRMVKGMPEFGWNTRLLPDATLALREAFQNAKSPEQFLFVLLPQALELSTLSERKQNRSDVERFFKILNTNLRLWTDVTPTAIDTARDILLKACGLDAGGAGWTEFRRLAVTLEPSITEPHLLTFVRRVAQSGPDRSGIESVLALVANRPPLSWSDADVDRFPNAAVAIGQLFRDALRSTGLLSPADRQIRRLSSGERRQADLVLKGVKQYLRSMPKSASPQAIRAALMRLIDELERS